MSSSSKPPPPPQLRLHVDTAPGISNGAATSPGSASSSLSSRSPRPPVGVGGASGGGHNQACAACKYQRRKCNPDCPLAPYFPADDQRRFLNAHRLFGVSNIQKTLRRIDPDKGEEAMQTLIYQSEARAMYPVQGCVAVIEDLQNRIRKAEIELDYVKQQIAMYRQAAAAEPMAEPVTMLPAGTTLDGNGNVVPIDALYAGSVQESPAGLLFKGDPPPQQVYNYFWTADDEEASSQGIAEQQLDQRCRVDAVPFADAFDVKPQVLPARIEHQLGPADDVHLKHDVDQHMEEPPATAARCHLELGFSSF